MIKNKHSCSMGTKAETITFLSEQGYNVPKSYYFTVEQWSESKDNILEEVIQIFGAKNKVAVRSSAISEDTEMSSMAGAFESYLNIPTDHKNLHIAISNVIDSFDKSPKNQVLIQTMVKDVIMSGVVMTKVLDDGSPYYVINYDDTTGKTDSITSGNSINKTVYIYNGVKDEDFDSKLLLSILKLVRSLEDTFYNVPIDIEFAININQEVELLQVRRIATVLHWDNEIHNKISTRIDFLKSFIQSLMTKRLDIYGDKTLFGIMPDWNPAEMIGLVPRPLATSLYRELITKRIWSKAREYMGYRKMPNIDLMVSMFGRPYIDVRNSFNSFLPEGLDNKISKKIVNAYLNFLRSDPHLHDKIEFDIVLTCYDFSIEEKLHERFPEVLKTDEKLEYKKLLKSLTIEAVTGEKLNSLNKSLENIDNLSKLQLKFTEIKKTNIIFLIDEIATLIGECKQYGTLPFSIIARHAFIAESLLKSLITKCVINKDRVSLFKRSFITIAGKMSRDLYRMKSGSISTERFLSVYGHLRPSSYDILSPRYLDRGDLFEGKSFKPNDIEYFELTDKENNKIQKLLNSHGFKGIKSEDIFDYAKKAITGREYAKFIFTKHLSRILELISYWGKHFNLTREQLSMLSLSDVLEVPYEPLHSKYEEFFHKKIELHEENLKIASSFKLSYLIRSTKDIHIVPVQRSMPNFIGNKKIEGIVVQLNPHSKKTPNLENKIVCIDSADPGYDWIFSKEILGLITKYGGVNSHMAIRCAELGIPAAIGCGDQPIERIMQSEYCILDCQKEKLLPL